ncbi:MAG: hypothetical protein ACOWWM_03045 [Desulfobacterales bacterium]
MKMASSLSALGDKLEQSSCQNDRDKPMPMYLSDNQGFYGKDTHIVKAVLQWDRMGRIVNFGSVGRKIPDQFSAWNKCAILEDV